MRCCSLPPGWPPRAAAAAAHPRTRTTRGTACRTALHDLQLLERSCLADLSSEQLEAELRSYGIVVLAPEEPSDDDGVAPAQQQHSGTVQQQSQQQQQNQHSPHQQQQRSSTRRRSRAAESQRRHQQRTQDAGCQARAQQVADAAARRALLLERLAAARVEARAKIVRLPLRLSIAGKAASRRYLTLPVDVEGVGFVDFLLEGSSYLSRITPALRDRLGISPTDGVAVVLSSSGSPGSGSSGSPGSGSSGSSSSGSSQGSSGSSSSRARVRLRQRVALPNMWLGTAKLPPQQGYVTPLQLPPRQQQLHMCGSTSSGGVQRVPASAGAVGGVLGVQVLREFIVDVDFNGNALALHPSTPDHVALGLCVTRGMVAVPLRLTKTGALVVPVSLAGSPPFTGLLDLSAANSMLNWEAAALLGMTCNDEQQQEQQQGQQERADQPGVSGISQQQQQPQQQQQQARGNVGRFGSIEVVKAELLAKPALPPRKHPFDSPFFRYLRRNRSSGSGSSSQTPQQAQQPSQQPSQQPEEQEQQREGGNGSQPLSSVGGSGGAAGYSYTPLRGSNIVQQHRVAADRVQLVLGHARLAAAATATAGAAATAGATSSSSSGSMTPGSLAVPPPTRFGVAGLKGLQLGLSARPVMVVGCDVWARQRAVICLKAGLLYLSPS